MQPNTDEQSSKPCGKPRRAHFLFEFILKVGLPAAVCIVLANLIFNWFQQDEPKAAIKKAIWAHNYRSACLLCKEQIGRDFFDLSVHRAFLSCCQEIESRNQQKNSSAQASLHAEDDYNEYSRSKDPNVADIGHYGLGFFDSLQKSYQTALEHFDKVGNRDLKYLNNSTGHAYQNMGDDQKAESYFLREIQSRGYVAGAYSNLARLYYDNNNFEALDQLVVDAQIRDYVPGRICRYMNLRSGRMGAYLREVFTPDYVTASGAIAALFVLCVWFGYLRRLDIFEPEKPRWLVITLLLGMVFSMLCGVLYDLFDFSLDMHKNGNLLNDLWFCIAGIGFIEEAVKIIPFLLILKFSKEVNESIDYIIYAAISALGFAFMENLLYFQDSGLNAITGRTVMSVMLHMALSATVAYGLFYARYRRGGRFSTVFFVIAFIAACIFHGLYDFFLITDMDPVFRIFSVLILVCYIGVFSNMIRNALNQSEFNHDRKTEIEGLSRYLVYSLSGVVLLHYLMVGWKLGIANANFLIGRTLVANYMPLLVIFGRLGAITVEKGKWLPLLNLKKRKQ